MNSRFKIIYFTAVVVVLALDGHVYPENIQDIDRRAQEYYERREFNKAIAEWLLILDTDPGNEAVQKKIEMVYDEKHKKDVSVQKTKIYIKLAKNKISKNVDQSNADAETAMENLVAAFRVDPNDPELQVLKEDMKALKKEIGIEQEKQRLSELMKKKYAGLLLIAQEKMKLEQYKEALDIWEEMLDIVPGEGAAMEGKRQAELAISNRLKFERVRALMTSGIALFEEKKYREAKLDFQQAVRIDGNNRDVKDYLDRIDDLLEEQANYEMRRMQAEQFYASGMKNLEKNDFDGAEDDFENVLALISDYKDTVKRLENMASLRKEYEYQLRVLKLKKIDTEFQKGLLSLTDGRYKDAILSFDAVLILDEENTLARKYMQTAKDALKQIREERVDADSPYYNIINSLIVSGQMLYDKGEYAESRTRWEKILDLFPKNQIATEYLLRCNLKLNPESFNESLEKIADDGRKLLKEKEYAQALRKFELVKSLSKNYRGIDSLIAGAKKLPVVIKKETGRAGPAVAAVSPAEIEGRIKNGIEYYRRGGKDNIEKALLEFRWVNERDPENTNALIYMNKIEAQLRVGTAETTAAARRLTPKQEQLVKVHYFKGINYYFNNDFDQAISEWRKVLAIDPEHEKAKLNIKKCLVLLKR